jgi:hypothetical protein
MMLSLPPEDVAFAATRERISIRLVLGLGQVPH